MIVGTQLGREHRDAAVAELVVRHIELLEATFGTGGIGVSGCGARQANDEFRDDIDTESASETQRSYAVLGDQLCQRITETLSLTARGCSIAAAATAASSTSRRRVAIASTLADAVAINLVVVVIISVVAAAIDTRRRRLREHTGGSRCGIRVHGFNVGSRGGSGVDGALERTVEDQRVERGRGRNQRLHDHGQPTLLELVARQTQTHQPRTSTQTIDECLSGCTTTKVVLGKEELIVKYHE